MASVRPAAILRGFGVSAMGVAVGIRQRDAANYALSLIVPHEGDEIGIHGLTP